jgi:hypothetical protein
MRHSLKAHGNTRLLILCTVNKTSYSTHIPFAQLSLIGTSFTTALNEANLQN